MGKKLIHPTRQVCPRSGENAGPVNLNVSDEVWDFFTPFQRFLWYVDEMEHRWLTMKSILYDDESYAADSSVIEALEGWGRPRFLDVTWNTGEDLSFEVSRLRTKFGCTLLPPLQAKHQNPHVKHEQRSLNCTELIRQDLEYRTLMKYDSETINYFASSKFPQHVDSGECTETRAALESLIKGYSAAAGMVFDESAWALPAAKE